LPDALAVAPEPALLAPPARAPNRPSLEETFGRGYMARFRRRPESRTGESTVAGERALEVTPAAALVARPRTA
jgi:hypothetical protein